MGALQIAHWFINRARLDEDMNGGDKLSLLKLEKLLYYAEGYSLATTGNSLYSEKIIAWKHGPVVIEVYETYKQSPFDLPLSDADKADALALPKKTKDLLEEVYCYWGEFSAWGLRNQTHKEAPWIDATDNGESFGAEMDRNMIKDYFVKNYVS